MNNQYNNSIEKEYLLEADITVEDENEIDIEYEKFEIFNTSDNDYANLKNKPQINGIELINNKQFEDLGIEEITNTELNNLFKDI